MLPELHRLFPEFPPYGGAFEDVTGTNGVHFYRGRYND